MLTFIANDREQAQSRVFEMIRRIVKASLMLKREVKVTGDKISFATGAVVTAIASDYSSAAGGHPTIAVFDEI